MKLTRGFSYEKTKAEKFAEFEALLAELRDASAAIDSGPEIFWRGKAKIISAILYVLLHDGGKNKSLLRRVGLRDRLNLPDTAALSPKEDYGLRLANIHVDASSNSQRLMFRAKLDVASGAPSLPFGKWWEGKIFSPRPSLTLARRSLVNVMRSQAGLGHSDDSLSDFGYCFLEKRGAPHVRYYNARKAKILKVGDAKLYILRQQPRLGALPPAAETGPFPVVYGPQACVRQIAWELDFALREVGY